MYFANPWGLLGLLAVPAILAIHFFHRRYPPLIIGGAHLWGIESEVQTMGRRWDRLPITSSLLLELLAALLLALLLSQPRLGILGSAKHLVVVLDHSASMLAAPPNGRSFRDRALEELGEQMESLPGGSRVTVILSGPIPQTIAGPAARWEEARLRLQNWEPRLPKHQFGPAWDLAAQFADESGELFFLTDDLPGEDEESIPAAMNVIAVGEKLRNVGITTAEWTFDPYENSTRVYLRVANFGGIRANVEVIARSPEESVYQENMSIAAGEEMPIAFSLKPGSRRLDIAVHSSGDGFPLDNQLVLIEPKPRPVTVSVDLPQRSAAREAVMRGLGAIAGVKIVSGENVDLEFTTAAPLPPSDPDLWWLGIGPLDRSEKAREDAVDLQGPYILKRRDPLVRGLALGTLIWGGAQPLTGRFSPIISCDQLPLFVQLEGTFTTGYLLNIDFARSQLAAAEDWPILLSNLIEQRRKNLRGLNRWNLRINESIRFRTPKLDPPANGPAEFSLQGKDESLPLVRGARDFVQIDTLDEPGVYELKAGELVLDRLAVNFFDSEESNLAGLESGRRDAEFGGEELFRLDNPYSWLVLLGLVLVLGCVIADWHAASGTSRS